MLVIQKQFSLGVNIGLELDVPFCFVLGSIEHIDLNLKHPPNSSHWASSKRIGAHCSAPLPRQLAGKEENSSVVFWSECQGNILCSGHVY